jgi:hypothetical protein
VVSCLLLADLAYQLKLCTNHPPTQQKRWTHTFSDVHGRYCHSNPESSASGRHSIYIPLTTLELLLRFFRSCSYSASFDPISPERCKAGPEKRGTKSAGSGAGIRARPTGPRSNGPEGSGFWHMITRYEGFRPIHPPRRQRFRA